MNRIVRIALLAAVVAVVGPAHASASTIGPTCGTCQGSTYTLTNLGLDPDLTTADGAFDTWRIALTIDTRGYDYLGTALQIDEVAVKVSSSVDKALLVSTPGNLTDWILKPGGINANGCSGAGSGFECSDWILGSKTAATLGGTLTWVFDIDVASPLLTGTDAASIKVRYVDASGNKVGSLVSENITLSSVPEPGTLSLLCVGGVAAFLRRRTQR